MNIKLAIRVSVFTILSVVISKAHACCQDPVASFSGPSSVYCGDQATFRCTSTDADSAISYRDWTASGGTPSTGGDSTFTTKWCSTGPKTVFLRVWDSDSSEGCPPDKFDDYDREVTVLAVQITDVTSDVDEACVGCDIEFTVTTSPADKYGCIEWSAPGGDPPTGSGETFITKWYTPGPKTVTATGCDSSKSKQVTVAAPTNFRETYREVRPNGVLYFEYRWDSTSGNLADLSGCKVGEKVDYPGPNDPYCFPPPWSHCWDNPTVKDLPAENGGLGDTHSPGSFSPPYQVASVSASQIYRYRSCIGIYSTLLGPISIDRYVSGGDSLWRYSIIKSGAYAEIFPLP